MLPELLCAPSLKSKFTQSGLIMYMLFKLFMSGTELRLPARRAHIGSKIFEKLTTNSFFNISHWMAIFSYDSSKLSSSSALPAVALPGRYCFRSMPLVEVMPLSWTSLPLAMSIKMIVFTPMPLWPGFSSVCLIINGD
jgi:hypothetical protein